MKTRRPVGYLNVDLEIVSSSALDSLAEEVGKSVLVLYSGPGPGRRRLLCLESLRWPNTPDAAARELCRAVERLSKAARKIWDHAQQKTFDVGYELPDNLRAVRVILQPETIRRITALGATIAFTCYRHDNNELTGSAQQSH